MATATSPWWLLPAGRGQIRHGLGLIYCLGRRIRPPWFSTCSGPRGFAAATYSSGGGACLAFATLLWRPVLGMPLPRLLLQLERRWAGFSDFIIGGPKVEVSWWRQSGVTGGG
jgi:hypothetical protein